MRGLVLGCFIFAYAPFKFLFSWLALTFCLFLISGMSQPLFVTALFNNVSMFSQGKREARFGTPSGLSENDMLQIFVAVGAADVMKDVFSCIFVTFAQAFYLLDGTSPFLFDLQSVGPLSQSGGLPSHVSNMFRGFRRMHLVHLAINTAFGLVAFLLTSSDEFEAAVSFVIFLRLAFW